MESLFNAHQNLHNNTPSRRDEDVCSNDTLGNTPFQLISDLFHVNQDVLCFEHAEQASSWGGGGNRLAK